MTRYFDIRRPGCAAFAQRVPDYRLDEELQRANDIAPGHIAVECEPDLDARHGAMEDTLAAVHHEYTSSELGVAAHWISVLSDLVLEHRDCSSKARSDELFALFSGLVAEARNR